MGLLLCLNNLDFCWGDGSYNNLLQRSLKFFNFSLEFWLFLCVKVGVELFIFKLNFFMVRDNKMIIGGYYRGGFDFFFIYGFFLFIFLIIDIELDFNGMFNLNYD